MARNFKQNNGTERREETLLRAKYVSFLTTVEQRVKHLRAMVVGIVAEIIGLHHFLKFYCVQELVQYQIRSERTNL